MNSLSFLIYFISVVESVHNGIGWILIPAFILSLASLIAITIGKFSSMDQDWRKSGDWEGWSNITLPYIKTTFQISLFIWLSMLVILTILPKKEYMIMIAASEIGERIIESPQGQSVVDGVTSLTSESTELLRSYIKLETTKIKEQLETEMNNSTNDANSNVK